MNSPRALYCFSAAAALMLAAPPAPPFTLAEGQTERDAELLVVGNYPSKQLKITEQDLDNIVAQFSADTVPIKIEHVSSPLDPLGVVSQIWRDGKKLMGKIRFDALVAPLIAKRAVRGLSCGLDWADAAKKTLCLSEVSLTLRPHVASAALLSEDADRIATLEQKLAALDADQRIAQLKRQGKVIPATELLARQLLSAGDGAAITLADGTSRSVADAAFALLSAMPAAVRFAETAGTKPMGDGNSQEDLYGDAEDGLPEMTPAQMDYCKNVLKVDPNKVREQMKSTTRTGTSDQPRARA